MITNLTWCRDFAHNGINHYRRVTFHKQIIHFKMSCHLQSFTNHYNFCNQDGNFSNIMNASPFIVPAYRANGSHSFGYNLRSIYIALKPNNRRRLSRSLLEFLSRFIELVTYRTTQRIHVSVYIL